MKEKSISLLELRQRNTRKVAALFLAPVAILMLVYVFYPIVDTFITSGYQWNGISSAKKFIGLGNWTKLLKDSNFWIAFKNNGHYHDFIYCDTDSDWSCTCNILRLRWKETDHLQNYLVYSTVNVICSNRFLIYLCISNKRWYRKYNHRLVRRWKR